MPIKDLQKNSPGLSRAGIIRLGYKMRKCLTCKKSVRAAELCPECGEANFKKYEKYGKEHIVEFPTQADHFVLTDAPGVDIALGESEPKELKIWFPFDDIDQVFPAYHQLWVAGGLVCRGDGEKIQYAVNPTNGRTIIRDGLALEDFKAKEGDVKRNQVMSCPGMAHDTYNRCVNCKPNAMLIVLLRDVPRLAYFQIATSSIHNIVNLTKQLTFIKNNVGKLQGVPFVLKIGPREISTPSGEDGKRKRQIKYLLSLEVDPEYYKRLVRTQEQLAAPERQMISASAGDVVEAEVIEPATAAPDVKAIDPPVWFAPNGGDDSEFADDDKDAFFTRVMAEIKFYNDPVVIDKAIEELGIVYDAENEDFIFDELAKHAGSIADLDAAKQQNEAE